MSSQAEIKTQPKVIDFECMKNDSVRNRIIYNIFQTILSSLNNCQLVDNRHLIINKDTETVENHQLLRDLWLVIGPIFKLDTKLKTNQKRASLLIVSVLVAFIIKLDYLYL